MWLMRIIRAVLSLAITLGVIIVVINNANSQSLNALSPVCPAVFQSSCL